MSSGADYHPRTGAAFAPSLFRNARVTTAAPVQNTWYTILNTTNIKVYDIQVEVEDNGETMEGQVTIDGTVYNFTVVAAADTPYRLTWLLAPGNGTTIFTTTILESYRGVFFEARALLFELRKTTAAGVGDLLGNVKYGQY